jgi:NADPH-dependent 2,4-dienoyl-CoA reductase/sulfur reductase-like enzyme
VGPARRTTGGHPAGAISTTARELTIASATTHLIIGASLAGAKAAETLRGEGFDGPLVMVGAEHEWPYERPPLSKDYVLGKAERETVYVHPQHWYAEHQVDLRLGVAATAIHPGAHEVTLGDGGRIGYAKLLLTTGSSPRRLPVPGAGLDGVLYLRNVGDSDAIKAAFQSSSRVAVIGAGWIGLEAAAAARAAGVAVTVLERGELPLLRVLGREVAQVFAALHRDHGVDLRCGVQVAEITGRHGQADGVLLADGSRIDADVIIAGVGITPTASSPRRRAWTSATASGSSTGLMRCTSPRPPPGRCSARTWPTTRCPTSSPTSTTWAWSTPATWNQTAMTRSYSAVTSAGVSSSPSG